MGICHPSALTGGIQAQQHQWKETALIWRWVTSMWLPNSGYLTRSTLHLTAFSLFTESSI